MTDGSVARAADQVSMARNGPLSALFPPCVRVLLARPPIACQRRAVMRGPILIVDDDPTLREALGRILRAEGHEVLEAASGDEAVVAARRERPALMVVDYAMPGMDGEMVLDALRSELDGTPTVLLTTTDQQQLRAERLGALGLCKPFQVEELLAAVDRHQQLAD